MTAFIKRRDTLADLRRSVGAIEAFGFSLSIIAPTLAMAFTTSLTGQSAGRAAPLAYLIGGIVVTLVGLPFMAFDIGDGRGEPGLHVPVGAIRRNELQQQHRDDRHLGSYPGVYRRNWSTDD
jgi:hypothetical protein